ncbi:MAG: DUF2071 domain-containing protein [Phycisphaerales bacterium JB063]
MPMKLVLRARLAETVLLTYRTPAESVAGLLPEGLELVRRGPWAFWSVACCRVEKMRPDGAPAALGVTFRHVAYRLRVQAMTASAELIDGLCFTHSGVDAPLPALFDALGNRLTDLRLHRAKITMDAGDDAVRVEVAPASCGSCDAMALEVAHCPGVRRPGSCFPTVEDARAFGRYPPRALSIHASGADAGGSLHVMRVERVDSSWIETPVAVRSARLGYFDAIGQRDQAELEWAVRLRPMTYRWVFGERHTLLRRPDAARRWSGVA